MRGWRILDGRPRSSTSKKGEYALSKDKVLALRNPGIASEVTNILTQVLRDGACWREQSKQRLRNFSKVIVLM
jgi:hypothetical protein